MFLEIVDRLAGAECFEDAILDESEYGLEIGFAVGLVIDLDGGGELADGFNGDRFLVVARVELAERAGTGGEVEAAFSARFGEYGGDFLVRKLIAEVEDEGLVFLGKLGELVKAFHKELSVES